MRDERHGGVFNIKIFSFMAFSVRPTLQTLWVVCQFAASRP
jgi:hypothetical protein